MLTLSRLAEKLLEKETLSLPDIVDVLGPRPFPMKKNLVDYLTELRERIVEDEEEAATPDDETASEAETEKEEAEKEDKEPKKEI